MGDIVYIDVLITVNLFVNYFLLLSTAKLLHIACRRLRLVAGAFAGALFSLVIFLPPMNFIASLTIKIPMALLLILISFGYCSFAVYIRRVLYFFGVNFLFAGVMFALWFFIAPGGMYYKNGLVYFNISALTLTISTVISYLIITLSKRLFGGAPDNNAIYPVEIGLGGKTAVLKGFFDSGNRLTDIFTGLPVIIVEFEQIRHIIPEDFHSFILSPGEGVPGNGRQGDNRFKLRVIPYEAIGAGGLLAAFKPDVFRIGSVGYEVLVGVTAEKLSGGEYSAILNNNISKVMVTNFEK